MGEGTICGAVPRQLGADAIGAWNETQRGRGLVSVAMNRIVRRSKKRARGIPIRSSFLVEAKLSERPGAPMMATSYKVRLIVKRSVRWSMLSVAAALLCLDPGGAYAAYPERNILLIVPFAPGGPT